jgi:exopolysaccharide biosynthesis polyprenyl glycosylphosphotransferase
MTPRAATILKLQETEPLSEPITNRRLLSAIDYVGPVPATDTGPMGMDGRAESASLVWREALRRRLLGFTDVAAVCIALLLVVSGFDLRYLVLTLPAGVVLVLGLFKVGGLYDRDELRLVHSTLDEAPTLLQLTGLFALGIAITESMAPSSDITAGQIAVLWMISFVVIFGGRVLARAVAGRTAPAERCLVIGESDRVDRIRQKLAASRARARVVAALPILSHDVDDTDWAAMPQLLRRVVSDLNVHRIIIAPTTTDTTGVVNLIRTAKAVGVRVSVLPRMLEVVGSAVEFDDIDGMTMLGVRRFGLSRSSRLLKRAFDGALTSVGLVFLSPVILAIALAIRLESPGPVLFRQVRVGRDGKHFSIFKFRSMVADAEAQKDSLRALNEAGDGLFKLTSDPRVTRVGNFLRHTSLDELPQLLNVLRGEMSLVGPRPLVIDEDAQVLGLDRSRLHLTPGMTGPWQILGSRVPMQEMVGLDYLYVANWSLWLDLKVMLRTVRHVARRGNL